MAKKSRKRLPRHERSEPGCIWNLMSLFDFRHGRSTKRLITDSRREAKQGIGRNSVPQKVLQRSAAEVGDDMPEMRTPAASVKELMAVEMYKDQLNDWKTKPGKNKRKPKKKSNRNMDVMELDAMEFLCENFGLVPESTNADNLDLEMVVDELIRISQRDITRSNDDFHGLEKLVAALKLVLNERRSGGNAFQSKEFVDAQQMLNSNKDSFLKLLKDQNSVLVKHFQKLVDDPKTPLPPVAGVTEEKPTSMSSQKHWSFFRRSRSLSSYPMEWDKDCLSPNKIVILRPGREGAQSSEARFSFTGIRRKLWSAMGKEKERQLSPQSFKLPPKQHNNRKTCYKISSLSESSSWSSPNRDHFYTERFAIKSGEAAGRFRDKGSLVLAAETFQYRNRAKKHLSDMLENRGENIESMEGQFSKYLGRTLSLTEYSGSPCRSPRISADDEMRELNLESPQCIVHHDDLSLKDGSLDEDPEVQEAWVEDKAGSRYQEAEKVVDVSSKFDAVEECAFDKTERPSPVSVLEPLFTDDNVSPASTSLAQPAEEDMQPRHIQFEEHSSPDPGICMRISLEDEESAFEYVEAVLLGSGLIWDEFLSRWLSEDEILDSSLFDEVELFSSRPRHNQKLLFDCANDALNEMCETLFRCFPNLFCAKTNTRPMPRGMDLIQEIWKRVEGCLFLQPCSHSLEQLIKRDLDRSRNWIKLTRDVQLICFAIAETILDELAEDSVMSLLEAIEDEDTTMHTVCL